jgi:glycosyltransferase involved in cell wall biosynthesis
MELSMSEPFHGWSREPGWFQKFGNETQYFRETAAMLVKSDLHVHSKYSNKPSEWILRAIDCAESYTEPLDLYRIAVRRGMDLVTITDHDTLAGSLEIAHLEKTFISEEISTSFPEDGCKVHILAFNITERHHEDISSLRENIYDLVLYLYRHQIVHALAHPLYSVNGRLTIDHIERALLLFQLFEINGTRAGFQNTSLGTILGRLTRERIEQLADRHGMLPLGQTPWRKGLIGGSDDHSGLRIATTFTQAEGSDTFDSFLKSVWAKNGIPVGGNSGPEDLTHNLYSIGCQYLRKHQDSSASPEASPVELFLEAVLMPGHSGRAAEGCGAVVSPAQGETPEWSLSTRRQVLSAADALITGDPRFSSLLEKTDLSLQDKAVGMIDFLEAVSEKILHESIEKTIQDLLTGDIFGIFQNLGALASVCTLLSPHCIALSVFTRERNLCRSCLDHFSDPFSSRREHPMKVAHFTDTFHDVNGVAKTLEMQRCAAKQHRLPLTMVTCGKSVNLDGLANFEPASEYPMPGYPDMTLSIPPILKMLRFCYQENFTHIHAATPGPVGLVALAAAKLLNLPICGTYHTALPQYTGKLLGSTSLERLMWSFVVWYYNQMNVVFVPSHATGEELISKGVLSEKIRFYERGVDLDRFHPAKRNGFFRRKFSVDHTHLKLLYVGRVSREKNLPFLVDVFKSVFSRHPQTSLVVVGEGPFCAEMKQALAGYPVLFTGLLEGEDLAEAYASSDIFLFPSTTDTFGNVVLEAQASGLPVIVSDMGGPRENLIPDKTGLIVPVGRIDAFVSAVSRLIENRSLRRMMGEHARMYVKNRAFDTAFLRFWQNYPEFVRSSNPTGGKRISTPQAVTPS